LAQKRWSKKTHRQNLSAVLRFVWAGLATVGAGYNFVPQFVGLLFFFAGWFWFRFPLCKTQNATPFAGSFGFSFGSAKLFPRKVPATKTFLGFF